MERSSGEDDSSIEYPRMNNLGVNDTENGNKRKKPCI